MTKQEAETLIAAVRSLVQDKPSVAGEKVATPAPEPANGKALDFDALYVRIKHRLLEEARVDPILLELIMQRPEIVIDVEPRVVQLEGSSLRGRVARLMAAGWFKDARATSACRRELARTGADPGGGGSLSDVLGGYVRDGFLVREGDGYALAPGVKITEREATVR